MAWPRRRLNVLGSLFAGSLRYAHRERGVANRVKLLLVRAALGTPCDMGTRVDAGTKNLAFPPVRVQSQPPVKYGSIRAGPHRPFRAGDGADASTIFVVRRSPSGLPSILFCAASCFAPHPCVQPPARCPRSRKTQDRARRPRCRLIVGVCSPI